MQTNIFKGILLSVLFLTGCKREFLDQLPEAELNNETFWTSESSLEIYNNGIYNDAGNNSDYSFMMGFYSSAWESGYRGNAWEDCMSDNGAPQNANLNEYQEVASGQHLIPVNPDRRGWKWNLLRRINFFLENYERTPVVASIRDKYAGEVKLFRAWFYFDKVKHFGDVPWIGKTLNTNSEELYKARDSRFLVMDSVLKDLDEAIAMLPEKWNKPNRFNKWMALALKSRICLYEGTWRKYHQKGTNADFWLNQAANAAAEVINNGPYSLFNTGDPANDYNTLFRQFDYTGNPEIISFRKYVTGVFAHRYNGYQRERRFGMTLDLVEDYLCTDGKPIQLSGNYKGDESLTDFFTNRDPRLRQTCLYPEDAKKYLTGSDASQGTYPRFDGMQGGGWKTSTGFTMIKYFDVTNVNKGFGKEDTDAILMRLAEVYLNFAEAKAELGTITQADLDMTINRLRQRAGMPHLTLNPDLDPKYSSEGLSAIIVEVRRERRVELAFEGFRYDDIIRWAKGEYLAKRVMGMRFEDAIAAGYPGANVKTVTVNGKKFIDVYQGSRYEKRVFDPNKHYLFPIEQEVLAQNPNITQNPGW